MKAFATLALLTLGSSIAAQEPDRALGPWVDVHYTHASGTTIDAAPPFQSFPFSTNSSGGGGATIGYGFLPWLSGFVTVDVGGGQSATSTASSLSGTMTLYQVDAGARFQWPVRTVPLTPYVLLTYSSRLLSGPLTGGTPYGDGTYSTWGGAVTFGAGVEYFFARAFAIDVSYNQSSGTYFRLEAPSGYPYETQAPSSASSRVLVGATWHPGPVAAAGGTPPHKTRPLGLGDDVRVRAGTTRLVGRVAFLGRDTLILQRTVDDRPVQTAVPISCLSTVERHLEPRPIEPALTTGAVIGAIGGGLVGAISSAQSLHTPEKPGPLTLSYILPGAVVGAAIGAAINEMSSRWAPLALPPRLAMSFEDREALCRPWSPPG